MDINYEVSSALFSGIALAPIINLRTVLQVIDDHKRNKDITWKRVLGDVYLERGILGARKGAIVEGVVRGFRMAYFKTLVATETARIRKLEGLDNLPMQRILGLVQQAHLLSYILTYPAFVYRTKQAEPWIPSRALPYSAVAIREGKLSRPSDEFVVRSIDFAARHAAALTCYLIFNMATHTLSAHTYLFVRESLPEPFFVRWFVMRTLQGLFGALVTPFEVIAKNIIMSTSWPRPSDFTLKKLYRGAVWNFVEVQASYLIHGIVASLVS